MQKEELKCNKVMNQYKKMINFDNITKENIKRNIPNWQQIPGESIINWKFWIWKNNFIT